MKLLLRIQSKLPKHKRLFKYLESQRGNKLDWKQKVQVMQDYKEVKKIIKPTAPLRFNIQKNSFFRYSFTAIASVALCLSIVLPITLPRAASTPLTPAAPSTFYTDDVILMRTDEESLRGLKGLLLFGENQVALQFGFVRKWGASWIEFADDSPTVLGYRIDGSEIALENGDTFMVDYRIRVHKQYQFINYFQYSALTLAKALHADDLNDQITNFNIVEQRTVNGNIVKAETSVSAFIVDGIKVFTYTVTDNIMGGIKVAFLHFEFGGKDYFINVSEILGYDVAADLDGMTSWVKGTLVPAIFINKPV